MFLKNCWYVAAWSKDVSRELLGRILLNETVVLYRRKDGSPVALENRCPHRNLPLSEGNLIDDEIECGYHGMVFNNDGVCTHLPGSEEPPVWATVKRYPIAERNGWVFYWPGDPSLADEDLLPDYHKYNEDEDWIRAQGQTHVKAGYRLVLDNLLDLSHLTFVHGSTTGNRAVAESADLTTDLEGNNVRVTRWMEDIEPALAFREYGKYENNIDRWQMSQFIPPAYININNGSVDTGVGADQETRNNDQGKWGFVVYHAMTPETDTTTHQFWTVAGHKDKVPQDMRELFVEQMHGVLKEDLDIYEAQQRAIDLDPESLNRDANPRGTIPADQGLLSMRRVIRRMYGNEQKAI
ncbi:MAG: Toluene-4-sulfonate monooxygenase system iron-sulfur subunit TsaM1 [Alphaproteobacteria bacterium MarineAlpha11_Bin1]|nr:MAG: Toluene-4-sulfonate monooxygenase system iron-sulfur subunit TsaM1 [Alphaproteobacteria bacterium MarineAlpha11_Bin1]|tara:strand:- start:20114 stop:21169 length:1056 start_codon:yes stop_codon:yes gene_type:complete